MSLTTRLAELVAFDTQNPSGDERPAVDALAVQLRELGAAAVDVRAVGTHAFVYARFGAGRPRLLVNAHVDTVPANAGYTTPAHTLVERNGRLHGLGAADTKGAIAAVMQAISDVNAAGRPPQGVGVLFSGDEERRGTCIREFLAEPALASGLERAVVCEPTGCAVGWRHRGIGAAEAVVTSAGGHSSLVDTIASPIAVLARAAVALDDMGRRYRKQGPPGFEGLCLNVASLDGGLAFNVIPTRGALRMSLRPAPGADLDALMAEAEQIARAAVTPFPMEWSVINANPPFQTRDVATFRPLLGAYADHPIDLGFWTEAALLAAAGIDAVVFGPGNIQQAHAADEFVEISQLEAAHQAFVRLFSLGSFSDSSSEAAAP
ncbi:MAG: M20/M25/M40 family metallo-hydrolase [Deltaproteobacteria bacterium]|nr:M20/M25/M40 family metallo-hydrolase [Deltaproteobacteria bacterium]